MTTDPRERATVLRELLGEESRMTRLVELCDMVDELADAVLYACGRDVAGWPPHLKPSEILERVGLL